MKCDVYTHIVYMNKQRTLQPNQPTKPTKLTIQLTPTNQTDQTDQMEKCNDLQCNCEFGMRYDATLKVKEMITSKSLQNKQF